MTTLAERLNAPTTANPSTEARTATAKLDLACHGPQVRASVGTITPTHAEWRVFGYVRGDSTCVDASVTVYGTNEHGGFASGIATFPVDALPDWLRAPSSWLQQATALVTSSLTEVG